ncbi:hypothetical protein EXIGLDRAFT_838215 [Exidia glandulosa HHB12029]|uniref:C2H2-type domain-containing protein n=1 Tax=Exidia glandulosa HHB12029 TaxID=1314781 RepID=A0A165G2R9_EXIGL|nr:hypothetical protein EXIGLDRAFT_838215 [Exidia glandulosa HHB12029]
MSLRRVLTKLSGLGRHKHRCTICQRSCDTEQGLNAHMTSMHPTSRDEDAMDWQAAELLGVTRPSDVPAPGAALPEAPPQSPRAESDPGDDFFMPASPDRSASRQPSVEEVPDEYFEERNESAGAAYGECKVPFRAWQEAQHELDIDVYTPFADEDEWLFAEWLINSGIAQSETEKLLKLRKMQQLGLSFHNNRAFLKKIDSLPEGVGWTVEAIRVKGDRVGANNAFMFEDVELWMRNPVDIVKDLLGNAAFADYLVYAPFKTYMDEMKKGRVTGEMWTADWWWELQKRLPPGATIAPIILASDKTQLTSFRGDKQAYPVYLTIGNLPKGLRRQPTAHGTVLLGYLPVSKLEIFSTSKARSTATHRLFHYCMTRILEPLKCAGKDGVDVECADGFVRKVYMVLAAYIADYPERCLIACCKGNQCPSCTCPWKESGEPRPWPYRARDTILDLLQRGSSDKAFDAHGLTDVVTPFWAELPHCDIFQSFPPDLLHQLHKGVFGDHVLQWCIDIIGKDEVDCRLMAMPSHPAFRHFGKGISMISQWNGGEYRAVEKVFLGVVAGHPDKRLGQVARALLDFIFCARMPVHSDETLQFMTDAYDRFHKYKKVFVDHGRREHFKIPKLHSLSHYVAMIRLFGAADGYNTESPERLHIDFCKEAYRASNHRDYIAQMTTWLRRREAMHRFSAYVHWTLAHPLVVDTNSSTADTDSDTDCSLASFPEQAPSPLPQYALPKRPSFPRQSAAQIVKAHGAAGFVSSVQDFVKSTISAASYELCDDDTFDVYKRVTIKRTAPPFDSVTLVKDVIRATPSTPASSRRLQDRPAFFDTALVPLNPGVTHNLGLKEMRVVRIRAIFTLPERFHYEHPLIFFELFNPFHAVRSADVGLLRTTYSVRNGQKRVGIMRLDSVVRSCFLYPHFGDRVDRTWTSDTVLDVAKTFFLNEFSDDAMYAMP